MDQWGLFNGKVPEPVPGEEDRYEWCGIMHPRWLSAGDSLELSHWHPVCLRYESFEYGLITQSYDAHVEQTLQRNRDLVNSLPVSIGDGTSLRKEGQVIS